MICHLVLGVVVAFVVLALPANVPPARGAAAEPAEMETAMKPLTDQQMDLAAREYCKSLGVDPDERVYHADPSALVLLVMSRMEIAAMTLREAERVELALDYGRQSACG